MAKAKLAEVRADLSALTLTFQFADGINSVFALEALVPEIRERLALHGLEQKLRDAYAGVETPAEARAMALKVWDNLTAGHWSARQAGVSQPRINSLDLLAQAVVAAAAATGRMLDAVAVRSRLESLDRSALSKLRSDPRVAAELARLRGKESGALESLF